MVDNRNAKIYVSLRITGQQCHCYVDTLVLLSQTFTVVVEDIELECLMQGTKGNAA